MYKNPELSSMAKILARELGAQGIELKHTQALEMVSKMQGSKSLNVEQARRSAVAVAPESTVDGSRIMFDGDIVDWAVRENCLEESEDTPERNAPWRAKVERSGVQFFVDVSRPGKEDPDDMFGKPALTLFVEVNQGLPCVHISNDLFGDQVMSIFATEDGLYLRPNGNGLDMSIRTGIPGDDTPGLRAVHDREVAEPFGPRNAFNNAFLVAHQAR